MQKSLNLQLNWKKVASVFAVSAVVYLMLKYSLFHNAEAAGLSASDWLGKYYTLR